MNPRPAPPPPPPPLPALVDRARATYQDTPLLPAHLDRLTDLPMPSPLTHALAKSAAFGAWLVHGLVTTDGAHLDLTPYGAAALADHRASANPPPRYVDPSLVRMSLADLRSRPRPVVAFTATVSRHQGWGLAAVSSTGRWAMAHFRVGSTLHVDHPRPQARRAAFALAASLHHVDAATYTTGDRATREILSRPGRDHPLGIDHPRIPDRLHHLLGIDTLAADQALARHRPLITHPTAQQSATLVSAAKVISRWAAHPARAPLSEAVHRIVTGMASADGP